MCLAWTFSHEVWADPITAQQITAAQSMHRPPEPFDAETFRLNMLGFLFLSCRNYSISPEHIYYTGSRGPQRYHNHRHHDIAIQHRDKHVQWIAAVRFFVSVTWSMKLNWHVVVSMLMKTVQCAIRWMPLTCTHVEILLHVFFLLFHSECVRVHSCSSNWIWIIQMGSDQASTYARTVVTV